MTVAGIGQQPGDGIEQGRLACAVRADHAEPFAVGDLAGDAVQRDRARRSGRSGRSKLITTGPAWPARDRSTNRKNGAPISAVITPIGTSAGACDGSRHDVGEHQERGAADHRDRQQHAVARPGGEPDRVRHDDADEADQPADRDGGRDAERRRHRRPSSRSRATLTPRLVASVLAHPQHVEQPAVRSAGRLPTPRRTAGSATRPTRSPPTGRRESRSRRRPASASAPAAGRSGTR